MSDFSNDPTQYLKHYNEQPTQSHLVNENGELTKLPGLEHHQSAKIVDKAYRDHSAQVAALNEKMTDQSNGKLSEALGSSLSSKYHDCQKTVQCSMPEQPQANDFKQVTTDLAVASEASHALPSTLDEHAYTIFQGQALQCRKYGFGFLNCCRESGWGQLVSDCSQDEIALGQAREKGTAIFVGTKKTGSKLKRKKYDVYCVFGSKLAKMVQEQGRLSQLDLNFGTANTPNCRGISPYEISKIDFDSMDLMQAYSSVANPSTLVDQQSLNQRITQKIVANQAPVDAQK